MIYLTTRKYFLVTKMCVIVLLFLILIWLKRYWRYERQAHPRNVTEEFERQVLADEARIVPGLGKGGVGARLLNQNPVNVYLSDRIPYHRAIADHRNPACQRVVYDAELPSASVIIIFHNEPYSVVLRTVWSVVNSVRRDRPWFKRANFVDRDTGRIMDTGYAGQNRSSQFVYLKEIILVDDNSTLPELKGKLSHYVRTRMPPDLIRILRLPDRHGPMRARLWGSKNATGEVMVFLDSHCEVMIDWLRPLLHRIKLSRTAVAVPIVDTIDITTLGYHLEEQQIGGFTFDGKFVYTAVSEREKKRRGKDINPTHSPTMAGGLFAINREYYWELGAYDEQMAGWGGENLEMSFRIWQCGGTVELIPCSRVGHLFRSYHPYSPPPESDIFAIDTARRAEVWMDDFKELFYIHRPELRKTTKIGNVTHGKALREKLQCKSFEWYLQNVYPGKFVPVRDSFGYGRFRNVATNLCLDTIKHDEPNGAPLGVKMCFENMQSTQFLALSLSGKLRNEELCATLQDTGIPMKRDSGQRLLMVDCEKSKLIMKWRYTEEKQLKHIETGLCVDSGTVEGADVFAWPCQPNIPSQRWEIDYNQLNNYRRGDSKLSEIELAFTRIRQQRTTTGKLARNNSSSSKRPALMLHIAEIWFVISLVIQKF